MASGFVRIFRLALLQDDGRNEPPISEDCPGRFLPARARVVDRTHKRTKVGTAAIMAGGFVLSGGRAPERIAVASIPPIVGDARRLRNLSDGGRRRGSREPLAKPRRPASSRPNPATQRLDRRRSPTVDPRSAGGAKKLGSAGFVTCDIILTAAMASSVGTVVVLGSVREIASWVPADSMTTAEPTFPDDRTPQVFGQGRPLDGACKIGRIRVIARIGRFFAVVITGPPLRGTEVVHPEPFAMSAGALDRCNTRGDHSESPAL
jgi:hypothetical protein